MVIVAKRLDNTSYYPSSSPAFTVGAGRLARPTSPIGGCKGTPYAAEKEDRLLNLDEDPLIRLEADPLRIEMMQV